jgi:hypothetical protein
MRATSHWALRVGRRGYPRMTRLTMRSEISGFQMITSEGDVVLLHAFNSSI